MNLLFKYQSPKPSDPAIKAISKALGQACAPVAAATFDSATQRRAGVEYRTVCLVMQDGQRVELLVKPTGDAFEVRINGSRIPVFNAHDSDAAAKEIGARLVAGRARFVKKQLADTAGVVVPPASRTARTNLIVSLTSRRDELKDLVSQKEARLESLRPA